MPSVVLGDFPEPDRLDGAPHPRETLRLFGHASAEAEVVAAHAAGRMHHAWLLTGPRGIGKATLAWRIARFLLATPEDNCGFFAPAPPHTLDIDPEHPVARRLKALSEPRLYLLRRGLNDEAKAPVQTILVGEVRRMIGYFSLSAPDGGARVAIVDAADDLNPNAANALLKLLEEPPPRVTFLLIAHQAARLLPTIRSRCRALRLGPLSATDLAAALAGMGAAVPPDQAVPLAELGAGSVGDAFRLTEGDGLALYAELTALLAGMPRMDRKALVAFAERGAGKGGESRFDLIVTLIDLFLARTARSGIVGAPPPEAAPGEAALARRLAPERQAARAWADLAQTLSIRARRGRSVNLDPAALLMDMVLQIDETATRLARR